MAFVATFEGLKTKEGPKEVFMYILSANFTKNNAFIGMSNATIFKDLLVVIAESNCENWML